jgi:hypothetical protein
LTGLLDMVVDDISPEQIANSTAEQAFKEAGLSVYAKLDKNSFKAFVQRGLGATGWQRS